MIAIDTTSYTQSLCFQKDSGLHSFHGEKGIFSIADILEESPDIVHTSDTLLVNIGPGPLTATRVGLSLVQGLRSARSYQCYAIKKSLLRSAWCYWQHGPGVYTVCYQIDSKHCVRATYQWNDKVVVCMKDDVLVDIEDIVNDGFPESSSALLMCDVYLWLKKRKLLKLLSKTLEPIYMRPAV